MKPGTVSPKVLTPAYYERLYALEQTHGWFRGMRALGGALIDPLLGDGPGWRVLDAGCGTGSLLDWLCRHHGTRVIGVDVSADALRFCRQRHHAALAQTSVSELPFPAETFDLIVCTDVLQHLPAPPGDGAAFAEAFRVLRPAGYLYVRTNTALDANTTVGDDAGYRRYSRAALAERARAAGFVVQRTFYGNSLPSLLDQGRRSLARQAPVAGHDNGLSVHVRPAGLRWIDGVLALWLQLEAAQVRYLGRGLPFGSALVMLARKPARSLDRK